MTLIEELTQPGTGPIVASIITGLISVQTLFLKWLINRFDKLTENLSFVTNSTQVWLKDHESKDQIRHEENLHRFETIAVSIAKIGK